MSANPFGDLTNDIAVGLLSTAMRETEAPVLEMAAALGRIKSAAERGGCSGLEGDIAICIQSLQFHDRLIQQLAAIRQLFDQSEIKGTLNSGFMPAEGSVELF